MNGMPTGQMSQTERIEALVETNGDRIIIFARVSLINKFKIAAELGFEFPGEIESMILELSEEDLINSEQAETFCHQCASALRDKAKKLKESAKANGNENAKGVEAILADQIEIHCFSIWPVH